MKLKLLILALAGFSTTSAFAVEFQCQGAANEIMSVLRDGTTIDPTEYYDIETEEGEFASEPTEVYYYYRNILDSWKVELTKEGCYLIGVNFIGDL